MQYGEKSSRVARLDVTSPKSTNRPVIPDTLRPGLEGLMDVLFDLQQALFDQTVCIRSVLNIAVTGSSLNASTMDIAS
ncbi:MAG TPA: hypothetical protein VEH06_10785 [Candidatus Bathyarchaeia archaeon]|nr:hypothetical protein [Candidatus Bathyarchaeia archaeon]